MEDGSELFEQAELYRRDLEELDRKHEIQTMKNDIMTLRVLFNAMEEKQATQFEKLSKKIEHLEKEIEQIKDQGGHNYGKGSNDRMGF